MLTPGNVVKVYKKEVLDNLVSGWNKVGFLSCKIYMEKELGRMKKELTTYDRGKCRKLFFCNFIKGEMKIKSIKILKTSYLVSLSDILNLIL